MQKVLVVGGGGREHALVKALGRSEQKPEILCAPGNAGIALDAKCHKIDATDIGSLARLAKDEKVDLTVVGPEAPLVEGIIDRFSDLGLKAFGPTRAAARLEGSKIYAKEIMVEAGVPTGDYRIAATADAARKAISEFGYPVVLKADGLAAGKGVIIAGDQADAEAALDDYFTKRRFGEAAARVLVEEHLQGEELSLIALCDGENVVPLAPAQDYKRIFDNGEGPNTGGMGSYSPVPGVGMEEVEGMVETIHKPVLDLMRERGEPYSGVLYAGLMLTSNGPRVLEFNCRFGDPETQAVLVRLKSDLIDLLESATVEGGLAEAKLDWNDAWAVNVVLASRGYPAGSSKGDVISGLDEAAALEAVEIVHSGTSKEGNDFVTAGGRVLGVTAIGPNVADARSNAYQAVEKINFDGIQYRTDIAVGAVDRTQVVGS